MITIATLGPANTFSELAAKKYGTESGSDFAVELFPTMSKAFASVGKKCDCAVLPIENMAEGYVSIVLDLLVHSELFIVHELLLPIQFSLAANCELLKKVETVYAQFVTQGQCENFLDNMEDIGVITTRSNGASLEQLLNKVPNESAIVPSFAVNKDDFQLVVSDIANCVNNQTRFVVIAPDPAIFDPSKSYKTSLLVFESVDRPGVLSEILSAFASRNLNMVSIMSRPTKALFGRYHFFIDVEGYSEESDIKEALSDIRKNNTVRLLGTFQKAVQVD